MKISLTILMVMCFANVTITAQEKATAHINVIIDKIRELESRKDAKCYATANRLEDFMYGTPLSDDARNTRIDIQKELIHYIKTRASALALEEGRDSIALDHLRRVLDKLVTFGTTENGQYFVKLDGGYILIKEMDLRQYSSVSYGYRALLSVEQDLFFFGKDKPLPLEATCVEPLYRFLNIMTLATLQIADSMAREQNARYVSSAMLVNAWVHLLESFHEEDIREYDYPELPKEQINTSNYVLKQIIHQKLTSYQEYNQLNASVFLRNIQVYFARQLWPGGEASKNLKDYFIESLIDFTEVLYKEAIYEVEDRDGILIRLEDVQHALAKFTPFEANMFEDICFFPRLDDESITIESYDLDAFRDSGVHWQILSYALADLEARHDMSVKLIDMDPHAAELVVEGIAQMAVLVLRLAGQHSHAEGKKVLDREDITVAFSEIQSRINKYPDEKGVPSPVSQQAIQEDKVLYGFENASHKLSKPFMHKSADWLSRLIRSYVYSDEEKLIRLAVPPAFGGSGVAAADINNDHYDDVLLLGGHGVDLYLNRGDGSFEWSPLSLKLSHWREELNSFGEVRQPIVADFDNDGYQDVFISYVNDSHRLYRNINGGDFEDVTHKAGLGGQGLVAGPATALDYDNDGLLDIFIGYFGNYLDGQLPTLSRNNQNGDPNRLFRNMGAFVFEAQPIENIRGRNSGWTQAMGHTDLNRDGLQDVIVGNDFGINEYYLNRGNGIFEDVATELGTDKPSYTMNVGVGDLNRDAFPDLYISNIVVMQKDEKYVSPNENTTMKFDPEKMAHIRTVEANDLFLSRIDEGHLKGYKLSSDVGRGYSSTGWSWDADFFDFDNDGDDDLYCLNGMNDFSVYSTDNPEYYNSEGVSGDIAYAQSNRERNVFFENIGGTLINRADTLNLDILSNSRSAAYLDIENDGDLDIIINNYHDEAMLMENRLAKGSNWIKIKLVGSPEAGITRDAIGAILIMDTEDVKGMWREIHSTDGYLSVHPKTQHFGLGTALTGHVKITWPNGKSVDVKDLKAGNAYEITYPAKVESLYE